jgi:Domain of unknown function (DUF4404)
MNQLSDRESLQALLVRVHQRLNEAGSVDEGSRELLGQVMEDIERALQKDGGARTHAPSLEALAVRFEADHPALAVLLRRLVDLLGKAGI